MTDEVRRRLKMVKKNVGRSVARWVNDIVEFFLVALLFTKGERQLRDNEMCISKKVYNPCKMSKSLTHIEPVWRTKGSYEWIVDDNDV